MVKFSEVKVLYDASALFLWSTGNSKGKKLPLASQALFLGGFSTGNKNIHCSRFLSSRCITSPEIG